jgi:capsular polysaccharide biosynthesis protein
MEISLFYSLIKRKKSNIALIILIFLVVGAVLTVSKPFEYESKSDLLIIKETNAAIDPYTASKSNELYASILTKVISTNSFFDEVKKSGNGIDFAYFPQNTVQKMKLWKRTVNAYAQGDSGIISISIFHTDPEQALQISGAVNSVMINKNKLYLGENDRIRIKVINEPVVSKMPVKPNIGMNMLLALVIGLILAFTYVYLFSDLKMQSMQRSVRNFQSEQLQGATFSRNRFERKGIDELIIDDENIKRQPSIPKNLPIQEEQVEQPRVENRNMNISGEELSYEEIIKKGDIRNIFGQ